MPAYENTTYNGVKFRIYTEEEIFLIVDFFWFKLSLGNSISKDSVILTIRNEEANII